jgi:hypothetical protein
MSRSSWTCTISAQSAGGLRAGDTGGALSGSPRWVGACLHAGEAILGFARLRTSGSR